MPKQSCPQCNRRLPYAARRCIHCGWLRATAGTPEPPRRRRRGLLALLALALLLGGGLLYRQAPRLAEWYAGFAARHLPSAWSRFAPTDTPDGAFFYCARNVARKMDGEFSVETFPAMQTSRTEELGAGRYRVESSVEEARVNGERVRHAFVCQVRFQNGRWVLESLNLTTNAEPHTPATLGLQSE